ncbi:MAG TPA: ASKHA domain-containing protein, partial [Geobacterales bacterium]|nr:ASKHA domain-containing protein [Geobacterales bacterium]
LASSMAADEQRLQLARVVNAELERLCQELLTASGCQEESLMFVAVAGNSAMEHLLLALPVERLAHPPYLPLFNEGQHRRTTELGWFLDRPLYLFPLPGGFVGGDLVAFLFGLERERELVDGLYIDLGTNAEIALTHDREIIATAAAAGPAFEGGNLSSGMPALAGAISRVILHAGRLRLETIDNVSPIGLCGSGVLSLLALLLEEGVIDRQGTFVSSTHCGSPLASRVMTGDDGVAFLVYRDATRAIFLSQEDIRQFQLAKGAVAAAMDVLFERLSVEPDAIGQVVLTGSFAAGIQLSDLKKVGLLPESMLKMTRFFPDGARRGVEGAMTMADNFAAVELLARRIRVIPLSGTPAFATQFLSRIDFPAPH